MTGCSLHGMHADSFQYLLDYLGIIEEFSLLSLVSSYLRSLREHCNFSHINGAKLKRLLGKVLNEEIHPISIRKIGIINDSEPKCADITRLVQIFQNLSPSMAMNSDIYTLQIVAQLENDTPYLLRNRISPKNIRSARSFNLRDEQSGIWIDICAFQCSEPRLAMHSPYSGGQCHRSYSIGRCSDESCDQPYFDCESCAINCYDCDMAGLCTKCISETPNSGEIVFVCTPCRGYCIWSHNGTREREEYSSASQTNQNLSRNDSSTLVKQQMVTTQSKCSSLIRIPYGLDLQHLDLISSICDIWRHQSLQRTEWALRVENLQHGK